MALPMNENCSKQTTVIATDWNLQMGASLGMEKAQSVEIWLLVLLQKQRNVVLIEMCTKTFNL